ncbi:MAG TPA: phosphatidylserine decarboxylase family protein [Gemmatimonadales bacterium]|nr:phosphatidylserine decarboxylase family protein [Gemmatimonadales bacterium]
MIRIAPEGRWFIAAAWAILLVLALLGWWLAAVVWLVVAIWVVVFFRDPERRWASRPDLIVAPADGRVVSVIRVEEPAFLAAPATRISIFMNVFDCHVNRYPTDGTVTYRQYNAGKFMHAAAEKSSADNEQSSIGLATAHGRLLVRQIAGWVARRIVTDDPVGTPVHQGERLGMIRFGSRVDVFFPEAAATPLVQVGDRTLVGVTPVARWN